MLAMEPGLPWLLVRHESVPDRQTLISVSRAVMYARKVSASVLAFLSRALSSAGLRSWLTLALFLIVFALRMSPCAQCGGLMLPTAQPSATDFAMPTACRNAAC